MAKRRLRNLRFPLGGLDRRHALTQQPPYTSPDCLNVRPDASIQDRSRGGRRPGLRRTQSVVGSSTPDIIGLAGPLYLLNEVTTVTNDQFNHWRDDFHGARLGPVWTTESWTGDMPEVTGSPPMAAAYSDEAGAVREAEPLAIDADLAYCIEACLVPHEGEFYGHYKLYARCNPLLMEGIELDVVLEGSDCEASGTLRSYSGGVESSWALTPNGPAVDVASPGWLTMIIDGDDVSAYWQGYELIGSQTVDSHPQRYIGFGMEPTVAGGICLVDTFRVQYYRDIGEDTTRRILVASPGANNLYRETWFGWMESVAMGNLNFTCDRPIWSVDYQGKLYIADNLQLWTGDDGTIGGAADDTLTAASVSDWGEFRSNLLGHAITLDFDNMVAVLSNGAGGTSDGTYDILAFGLGGSDELALDPAPGAGTCSYSITRAPKIYDPSDDSVVLWEASEGSLPMGCHLICAYRDRIVLAGQPAHMWYMSRQGDPLDWDYGADATDVGRAVAGTTSDAGRLAQPISAIAAHGDDYLLIGCVRSLWVMRGDPAYGGQIDNVSRVVGPVGPNAWCWGPGGEFVFLSRDGLYVLAPGAQGVPQSISREKLPDELLGVDGATQYVNVEYDVRARGVHVFVTPIGSHQALVGW